MALNLPLEVSAISNDARRRHSEHKINYSPNQNGILFTASSCVFMHNSPPHSNLNWIKNDIFQDNIVKWKIGLHRNSVFRPVFAKSLSIKTTVGLKPAMATNVIKGVGLLKYSTPEVYRFCKSHWSKSKNTGSFKDWAAFIERNNS